MKYLRFFLLYVSIALLGKATNYSFELFIIGLIGITLIYLSIQKLVYQKFKQAFDSGEQEYLQVTDLENQKMKTLISVPLYFAILIIVLIMYLEYGGLDLLKAFTILPVFVAAVAWTEKLAFPMFQYGIVVNEEFIREGAFGKKIKWNNIKEINLSEDTGILKYEGGKVRAKLSETDLKKLKKLREWNCEWNESTEPNGGQKANANDSVNLKRNASN